MGNLFEHYSRIELEIRWREKMSNIFIKNDNINKEFLNNFKIFLKENINQNKCEELNIKEVKVLDISYFHNDIFIKNKQDLLLDLSNNNNIYIIDCSEVSKVENNKSLGNLSSFYYDCKDKKTTFIFAFKEEDMINYGARIEQYQHRSLSLSLEEEDLKIFKMYQEMSNKYTEKNKMEKKKKI